MQKIPVLVRGHARTHVSHVSDGKRYEDFGIGITSTEMQLDGALVNNVTFQ